MLTLCSEICELNNGLIIDKFRFSLNFTSSLNHFDLVSISQTTDPSKLRKLKGVSEIVAE